MPKNLRAIGIGIANGIQNVGYFFSGLLIGTILDLSSDTVLGYKRVNYSMATLNATGVIILFIWNCVYPRSLSIRKQSS